MISCLTSSYFYAYVAAFYHPDEYWWSDAELIYEIIFVVDMGVNFITEYVEIGCHTPVRDLGKIALRYVKGYFLLDLIPLLPTPHMNFEIRNFSSRHFYILKILRIIQAQELFNVQIIYAKLKNFMHKRLAQKIIDDPVMGEEQDSDQNQVTLLINLSFLIKIIRLIVIITNISYFIGFLWYCYCDILREAEFAVIESDLFNQKFEEEINIDSFQEYFGMDRWEYGEEKLNDETDIMVVKQTHIPVKAPLEKGIISVYFAFTTLSTVGFGDYYPYSTYEKLFGSFMLLFGVAIFSLFMGTFIEMIEKYKEVARDLEDGDGLAKFFGVLKRFNGGIDINIELKKQIEEYFDYRWSQDRNQCLMSDQDVSIFDQLPDFVQQKLFTDFMFK